MNKSGQQIGTKELLELLIGVAAIVILIWLLVALIEPNFDKDEETAENYLNSLKDAIDEADSIGSSEFSLWLNNDEKFYLVYFNDERRYLIGKSEAFLLEKGENLLCVCYFDFNLIKDDKLICNREDCVDLDKEACLFNGSICKVDWEVGGKNFKINIKSEEDKYVFTQTE